MVGVLVRLHGDRAAALIEGDDRLVQAQIGAQCFRLLQLGAHASLGTHEAADGVVVGLVALGDIEGGIACPDCRRVENLVVELRQLGGSDGGSAKIRHAVIGSPLPRSEDDQQAVLREQVDTQLGLELAPDLVRAHGEGRIFRPLAAGDAGDARVAVGRAEFMRRRVAIDPQHLRAAPGQLVGGGGAHGAQAQDSDIVSGRHLQSSPSLISSTDEMPRAPFADRAPARAA